MPATAPECLQHSAHPGFNVCTLGLVCIAAVAAQTSSFNTTHNVALSHESYYGVGGGGGGLI